MTYRLRDEEFQAVIRQSGPSRYEHLVKRAADRGELWGLQAEDGWVLGMDQLGREFFPVWPHPRYAEASAEISWAGATPVPIPVREWIDSWTPTLTTASRLVGIFPTDDAQGVAIDPESFAADLRDELSLVEDEPLA